VRFDQVIHPGGPRGVRPSLAAGAGISGSMSKAPVNVLEAAAPARLKKVTLALSSVYGLNSKTPFSETDPIFSAVSALCRQQARV